MGSTYDELVGRSGGGFGTYQRRQFAMIVLPMLLIAMSQGDLFFQVASPRHWCSIDNATDVFLTGLIAATGSSSNASSQQQQQQEQQQQLKRQLALPADSSCSRWQLNLTDGCFNTSCSSGSGTGCSLAYNCGKPPEELCPNQIQYGGEVGTTIVTEFGLFCDKTIIVTIIKSISQVGDLFGSVAFGHISDRFGRRPAFLVAVALLSTLGIGLSFAPSVEIFATLLTLRAFVIKGLIGVILCLTVECIADKRTISSLAFARNAPRPLAQVAVSLLAFWLQDWRIYTLVIAAPQLLLCLLYFTISESPSWLMSKCKVQELQDYILRANASNGGQCTEAEVRQMQLPHCRINQWGQTVGKSTSGWQGFLLMMNGCRRFTLTVSAFFMLVVVGLGNQAILFSMENQSGSFYLNFSLLGLTNAVAIGMGLVLADRAGVITLIRLDLAASAAGMAAAAASPGSSLAAVASLIAKVFFLNGISSLLIYITQLYPTTVRNLASGIMLVAVSVGGVLAPLLLHIGESDTKQEYVPFLVLSCCLLVSLLISFTLPAVPTKILQDFNDFDEHIRVSSTISSFTRCRSTNQVAELLPPKSTEPAATSDAVGTSAEQQGNEKLETAAHNSANDDSAESGVVSVSSQISLRIEAVLR